MKKIFYIVVLLLISGSCNVMEKVVGNGIVQTKTISLPSFTGVSHDMSHQLTIRQGDEHKILLKGDSNVLNKVSHEVKDGVLYIDFVSGSYVNINLEIEVTLQSLELLENTSSGDINLEKRKSVTDNLRLITDGSGSMNIQPQSGLKKLSVLIDGGGDITFEGESRVSEITITTESSGNLFAYTLIAEECEIFTDGGGDLHLTITDEIVGTIDGSGDVFYSGDPRIKVTDKGSGDLIHKN